MELKEVFEPIINFMKSFQKKEKDISKQAAKDRLKLVLMQDRASVSPDFFEMMKKEIIDVIKKYIEIDEESLEVQLTRGYEAGLEGPALYANIPIKNIKPVAPNTDDETEQVVNNIADEILDEASKKIEGIASVKAEIESVTEMDEEDLKKNEDLLVKPVESIAENVAKEMKKATKSTPKNITKVSTRTTKKADTTKKTVRKSTTKKNVTTE